jgi:hypothetical protein
MKKLLVAAELKPLMMNAMDFLQRDEISVLTASTHDDMLRIHIQEIAHLLITRLDLPGMACETLVHTIRRAEHMRNVSILLLSPDTPAHRERSSRCGVNAVLPLPVDPAIFAGKVQEFLAVAPRRHYRVVLNIAVDGKHNDHPFLCNMENISASGMLIRTPEHLNPGERIACSFYLPTGKRIGTSGEVVRIVKQATNDGVNRYGIHFLSLAAEAASSIGAFVDKDLLRKQPPDTGQTSFPAA